DLAGRRGLFLAEGALVVRRLLEESPLRMRSALVTEGRLEAMRGVFERRAGEAPVYVASQEVMDEIVGFHIHRGVLAAGERGDALRLEDVAGSARAGERMLVLEDLANHDNVGGVFRNAASFGARCVVLNERCCDPLYRKAIRVSVGAALTVSFARYEEGAGVLKRLRAMGWRTAALTPRGDAEGIRAFAGSDAARAPLALVLGAEGPGLSEGMIAGADHRVRIEMAEGADSLNVATASAVALHALGA
ncbi:MAG: RNA methyltransferase, partial [Planctomycetota bacterium]|nr:RNA methyltransferase [Planctomycetota bacterium]